MNNDFKDNNAAFEYAKKFTNSELLVMFKEAEKSKRFGSLYYHPGKALKAEFVFHDGLCLRCIEPVKGHECTFNNSIKFW
jgi:hypothetical protein